MTGVRSAPSHHQYGNTWEGSVGEMSSKLPLLPAPDANVHGEGSSPIAVEMSGGLWWS